MDRQWTGQRRAVSMNLEAKWEGSPGAGETGELPWRWGSCAAVLGEARLEEHLANKEGACNRALEGLAFGAADRGRVSTHLFSMPWF